MRDGKVPDWIVHICVAYLVCRILYFKYPLFNSANTTLAMVGALLPDIIKLQIIFSQIGIDLTDFLPVFHIPITSFLMAGVISLFFENKKIAFLFLVIGAISHFAMDSLLVDIGEGMYLFFPFSWQSFHMDLIPPDDYWITLFILTLTFLVYLLGLWIQKYQNIPVDKETVD